MNEEINHERPTFATGCLFALVGLSIFAIIVGSMFLRFLGGLIEMDYVPFVNVASMGTLLLVGLGIVVWLSRRPSHRAVYQTWLLAAPLPPLLALTSFFQPVQAQWSWLTQMGLLLLYGWLVHWLTGKLRPDQKSPPFQWRWRLATHPLTGIVLVVLALPWIVWGALGSVLDSLLVLGVGLLWGWLAARLIAYGWESWLFGSPTAGLSEKLFTGGFGVGVLLLILGSYVGVNGGWMLVGLTVPALGWLALQLGKIEDSPTLHQEHMALFLGLAFSLPLLFSDSDLLPPMFLFYQESIIWSLAAAGVMLFLAYLLMVILWLISRSWSLNYRRLGWMVASSMAVSAGILYFTVGQPGFYGDRLFIILHDQADLTDAAAIGNYQSRRQFVYDTLTDHANHTQADLRQILNLLHIPYTPYYLVNGIEVQGGLFLQLAFSLHPDVERILMSPALRPLPYPINPEIGSETIPEQTLWNLQMIGADKVWEEFGVRGQGIVIGQSDSGADWTHPELRNSYRGFNPGGQPVHNYNWLDVWDFDAEPTDYSGHGTHTLGIALGEQVGVAPDAQWFGCKNLGRNLGNAPRYLDCMQFMLAPYPVGEDAFQDGDTTLAADVLNNSWGCPEHAEGCDPNALLPAVEALRMAGIFVVASAGNDGPECNTIKDPIALYDAVFTVGAVDQQGAIAFFSSVGPVTADGSNRLKPDVVAPGDGILSAYPSGTYYTGSGTSQAGPHVAGIVALIWSANPALIGDIEQTEEILRSTAAPYPVSPAPTLDPTEEIITDFFSSLVGEPCSQPTDTVPNPIIGYGLADAYKAVQMALQLKNQ